MDYMIFIFWYFGWFFVWKSGVNIVFVDIMVLMFLLCNFVCKFRIVCKYVRIMVDVCIKFGFVVFVMLYLKKFCGVGGIFFFIDIFIYGISNLFNRF